MNVENEVLMEVPIKKIKRLDNSRLRIEEDDLASLMEDIKHRGLLQPIGLVKEGEDYIIRFGNRRLEAVTKLGWKTIPANVKENKTKIDIDNFLADNVAENTLRVDLSPFELAVVAKNFYSRGYSISEIASKIGVSAGKIKNSIRLSKETPKEFQKTIKYIKDNQESKNKKGAISVAVASRIFNPYVNKDIQRVLFEEARHKELNARQVELIINMSNNMDIEQALKLYKQYKFNAVSLIFKKSEIKKY